jgi:hypothetical protein
MSPILTSTLMIETEIVSETLVFDLSLTRLNARESFITLIRRENFKSYIALVLRPQTYVSACHES